MNSPTHPSWTIEGLETSLQACHSDGRISLSGAALGSEEVRDLLASLGLEELLLERAEITKPASDIKVAGDASLFSMPIRATTTFAVEQGQLSVTLLAEFKHARAELPFIKLGIGNFAATLSVRGPVLDLPVVAIAVAAVLDPDGLGIHVTLAPDERGWLLRAEQIPLPKLSDVAKLLGRQEVASMIPPDLADLGGLSVAEFRCALDPARGRVHSIAAILKTEKEWPLVPSLSVLALRDVVLTLGVDFPEASAEQGDEDAGADTDPIFSGSVSATMKIGGTGPTLPVRLVREGNEWRFGVLSASGFPSVGELIGVMSDQTIVDSLPAAIRTLQLASSSFEMTIADESVRSVFFEARLAEHWPIVEHPAIEVENAWLQLRVDRADGASDVSGFLSGTIRLGDDVEVPVAVRKPGQSEPWTLFLACGRTLDLGGVSSLAKITPGDGAAKLPDIGDAQLALSKFLMAFDPKTHAVTSIDLEATLTGAWPPPGLVDLDLRDVTLTAKVYPKVETELLMTVDVGKVQVPIRARWEAA